MTPLRNLAWGFFWGLSFAAAAALMGSAVVLIGGAGVLAPYNLTFGRMLLGYALAGMFGGAVVGLLRPLAAAWWGAALVGLCAAVLVFLVLGVLSNGAPTAWARHEVIGTALAALVGGPLGGIIVKYKARLE